MTRPYKVFHSGQKAAEKLLKKTQVVLIRPERGGNVGSIARAVENMGLGGKLWIVDAPNRIDKEAFQFAKHAKERLLDARHAPTLSHVLEQSPESFSLAATARTGSASRPNPMLVSDALPLAKEKFDRGEIEGLTLVFGPESSGLTNDEIECCDWVVTIPTGDTYTSLNLAQAVTVFCYELRRSCLLGENPQNAEEFGPKEYLASHLVKFAEAAGFVLPGDPFKMSPQLEKIAKGFQGSEREIQTLHGLLAQATRNLESTKEVERKGRYRVRAEKERPRV